MFGSLSFPLSCRGYSWWQYEKCARSPPAKDESLPGKHWRCHLLGNLDNAIQVFARLHEGDKRTAHLKEMRLEALAMMRLLLRVRPLSCKACQ